jgi:hypothetical protein
MTMVATDAAGGASQRQHGTWRDVGLILAGAGLMFCPVVLLFRGPAPSRFHASTRDTNQHASPDSACRRVLKASMWALSLGCPGCEKSVSTSCGCAHWSSMRPTNSGPLLKHALVQNRMRRWRHGVRNRCDLRLWNAMDVRLGRSCRIAARGHEH